MITHTDHPGRRGPGGARPSAVMAAVLALAVVLPSSGVAQAFHVDRRAANVVRFVSRAATEEFDGVTSKIDGYVTLDAPALGPRAESGATELHLEVDLASLETGIGLRDRHMRERYLEVSRYPFAVYHGRILRAEPEGGDSWWVTARGELDIHGVACPRDLTCRVEARGQGYRARCAFEVLLSDHRIEIPKVMFLKLANEISLELDFSVAPAANPDGGFR